jgi:hypothetical protein
MDFGLNFFQVCVKIKEKVNGINQAIQASNHLFLIFYDEKISA